VKYPQEQASLKFYIPLSNRCTLCARTKFTINTQILSLDHHKTHNSKDIAYYMVINKFYEG